MTIALRAAGTATAATAAVTAVNPAVPTGATTGDLSVLTVWVKPYNTALTTPDGWTKIGEHTNGTTASGTDSGSTKVAVYVCESATVGAIGNIGQTSANTMGAAINSYSKTADAWDFTAFTSGAQSADAANYSATGAAGIDVAAGDWVLSSTAANGDAGSLSSKTIGGMAGATLGAITNHQTAAVTTGDDSRGCVTAIPVTAGSSNDPPTYTYINTVAGSGTTMWLRLRETTGGVTGTSAQTLPALTQAASGTYTTPGPITGTAAQTLPALTQAASGSFTGTGVAGTVAQTLPALTQAAVGSSAAPLGELPASGPVQATGETPAFTEGTAPDADDPAIWYNAADPSLSVIIGTNKASPGGGLGVFDLTGTRTQYLSVGKTNNVDLRDGVFSGRVLVISSNRTTNAISFFWLDRTARTLSTAGETTIGFEPYGCALYVSSLDGTVYAFITENAPTGGAFRQYELTESGGTVSGTLVRSLTTTSLSEGLVADDATRKIFLSQEGNGFYVYGAEPGDGSSRTTIDTVGGGGHLVADVEGCAIAYDRDGGAAYVIVSSQGNATFHVYDLLSPHAWRKSWSVEDGAFDAVTDSDGCDVTREYLSPAYPNGIIVVQDGTNTGGTNFKLIDAGDVLGTYTLPAFTGTSAQTLPALSQAAAGTAVAPAFTGTIASILPALTQAAAGTTGAPSFTGSVAQSLPALTQAIIGTTNPPAFTATAAQALPALTQSAAGTTAPPSFTGTITSTLPALTQAASGSTGTPTFTGTITQMLPALTQSGAGDTVPPAGAGTIAQILPALTQSAAGTTTPPAFTATTVQMLPALIQAAAGTVAAPAFTATVTQTLPMFEQSASGATVPPVGTGTITQTLPSLTQAAVGAFMVAAITGIIAQVLPSLTQAALDDSGFRDLTITITGPTGHPMSPAGPVGNALATTGPVGHPMSVTGPRS